MDDRHVVRWRFPLACATPAATPADLPDFGERCEAAPARRSQRPGWHTTARRAQKEYGCPEAFKPSCPLEFLAVRSSPRRQSPRAAFCAPCDNTLVLWGYFGDTRLDAADLAVPMRRIRQPRG